MALTGCAMSPESVEKVLLKALAKKPKCCIQKMGQKTRQYSSEVIHARN